MSMAANPIASDEGSDLEIEEVEVLNPLDLSVEDVYDSNDNVNENYQVHEEHHETETNASVDEDSVRVPAMNNQIGSESDTDNFEIEDDEDEENSVVIENSSDDIVTYVTDDEVPVIRKVSASVNGFQEAFNQNLINQGASTSANVQNCLPIVKKVLLRRVGPGPSKGKNSPADRHRLAVDEHDYANNATTEENDDIEYSDGILVTDKPSTKRQDVAKRPSSNSLEIAVTKKARQSENLVPGADPNPVGLAADPVEPEQEISREVTDHSLEELRAENARLRQELDSSNNEKANVASKYDNLVTKMQAKVECPVCFDVPKKAPVPVCPNGHVVCQGCKRDLCPTCRVRMGHGTSILAVTVIENIPHSCEFQLYGCQVSCSILSLPTHQATCRFRAVKCPNFNCVERVPLTTLAEHTLRRCIHNGTFYNTPLSNSYNYIIPANQTDQFDNRRNSTWRPDGITHDGKNFFLKITRKGKKAMWYFYVQMAGSEADAEKYTATIYVFKTSMGVDGKNSHRFIGDICPIDLVSTDRAAEAGYCCVLTDAQMKRVFTEGSSRDSDKKYGFSVEVRIESDGDTSAEAAAVSESINDSHATPGSSSQGAEGGQDQEPNRRIRAPKVSSKNVNSRTCDSEQIDRDGFRIMRHQRPPSPLNLVRRPTGSRSITSPALAMPGTSVESVGPFVVDDYYVPRTGARGRKLPNHPDSDDSSGGEDLVPCPQCGREYEISGVVRHAQGCQAGAREQR